MEKTIEIPEGYEARIEGNKVILERKESEDERIREQIEQAIIEHDWSATYKVSKDDCLAYLERQKEQKPLSTEEIELNSIAFLEQMGYTCIPPGKEQKPAEGTALQKAFISSKTDYTLEEKCDASDYAEAILPTSVTYGETEEEYKLHKIIEASFIAGQKKEQKLVEWSDADMNKARKDLISLCRDWERGKKTTLLPVVSVRARYFLEHLIEPQRLAEKQDYSGLKDLEGAIHRGFLCAGVENVPVAIIKETANECLARMKPAEWSEEDKRKINRIYEILGHAADDKGFLASKRIIGDKEAIELQDWLKSLRPPLKDREMKLKILKYLSTRCSSLEFEEVEDYLNNLRPSWKPSEEQMIALRQVISGCSYDIEPLVEIEEHLKKLREE